MGVTTQEAAAVLRKKTEEAYPLVLQRYGQSYANGWRFGRERAAEDLESSL